MPEPRHSPYAENAKTIPRMLQRWLDINAQNGPLTRTRKYLTFPSFEIASNWRGYSSIIGEYLFSSDKCFSLLINDDDLPIAPNYTLCISCIKSGIVYRYRIFSSTDENIFFEIPQYNGETIQRNFKFEIWSANVVTCVNNDDITFYTSVLGDEDYRYGIDSVLTTNFGLCEGQQSEDMNLPLAFGTCTYNYGPEDGIVLLVNQIQQIIKNENGDAISL